MLNVGLTGGIGSGKTLISKIFRSLNIPVYEADAEARRIMETDPEVMRAIHNLFGEDAFKGTLLNRPFIAGQVFKNKELLEKLNAIVHPAVEQDFMKWSELKHPYPYVIEEAAILFESGAANRMDYTIFVKSDKETRLRRVMKRDKLSREDVLARMNNQLEDEKKESMADFVILNEEDTMILPQVINIHNHLTA